MQSVEGSFLDGRVLVVIGDITKQVVGAIVNAANSSLMGGGGVDGAIHRAGGPQILAECREIRKSYPNGLPTGQAVLTTGGLLAADYVIHTVGPVFGRNQGRDAELLAACYQNSLRVGVEHGISSIAFPAISTGIFGYPKDEAAAVSSTALREFLASNEAIEEVRMVFFAHGDASVFLENQKFE